MAIIGVMALLSGLLLPVLNQTRRKTLQACCAHNLKQIGGAINLYANDHDGRLPGAVNSGTCASYDITSNKELAWYITDELGLPRPSIETVVAEPFVCPGYKQLAPRATSMFGRRCYLLNENVGTNCARPVAPFGSPDDPMIKPLTYAALEEFGPASDLFAITDMDKGNVDPTVFWWADLPYVPVHNKIRNQLFFDWHVEPKQW